MEIEKYSPKWLLEKINASKTDAHKLMHIIEYRNKIFDSTEKQFAIHSVSNTEGKCCPHCGKCNMNYDTDGSYLNWECKTFP